jgi:hypothetical protein
LPDEGGWQRLGRENPRGRYDEWGVFHPADAPDLGYSGTGEAGTAAKAYEAAQRRAAAVVEARSGRLRLLPDPESDHGDDALAAGAAAVGGLRGQEPLLTSTDLNLLGEPVPPRMSDSQAMRLLARAWRRLLSERPEEDSG